MGTLHETLGVRHVINARGTFTPLGVSRSPEPVIEAVAESLKHYFSMDELLDVAGRRMAELTGAEWGTLTHCTSASITLTIAACMTGSDSTTIRRLPDTTGLRRGVVVQAGHLVDYGQPIEQAVRLSGAVPVVAGSDGECTAKDLQQALSGEDIGSLVIVDSRLCRGDMVPTQDAVEIAHGLGVPVIVDAAAQDLRLAEVLATGTDLALFSAQKYLAAPTAGIVLGPRDLVDAVRLQLKGIGRGMKAGKEAIIGALAALQYRHDQDMEIWREAERKKADAFCTMLNELVPVRAELIADPAGNPFVRIRAWIDEAICGRTAQQVEKELQGGNPLIAVQDHDAQAEALVFEIIGFSEDELTIVRDRIAAFIT